MSSFVSDDLQVFKETSFQKANEQNGTLKLG